MSDTTRRLFTVEMKIEPKSARDADRLLPTLALLASEDSAFGYTQDRESGEILVLGSDEAALEAKINTLRATRGLQVLMGAPQVRYRETLAGSADVDYAHDKRVGSVRQFACVRLRLEANSPGAGNVFACLDSIALSDDCLAGVENGVRSVWEAGDLIGFPIIDTKITLLDAEEDATDSNAQAFEIAARHAMREGAKEAGLKLLEPIMLVDVSSPLRHSANVIADLQTRRARLSDRDSREATALIRALVPMAHLFGYAAQLDVLTEGLASHTAHFSHMAEVPRRQGPDDFPPASSARA